jgi:Proteins containing SET domain
MHGLHGEYEVYAPGHVSSVLRLGISKIHRTGCFAVHPFVKGYLIGLYSGQMTFDTEHPKTMHEVAADGTEYGVKGEGPLSYMNHSKIPSCELDGFLIYAARVIDAGEELTIDYGWE